MVVVVVVVALLLPPPLPSSPAVGGGMARRDSKPRDMSRTRAVSTGQMATQVRDTAPTVAARKMGSS